jgi:hypothetical protein
MRLLLLLRLWMVGRVLLGRFEWFHGLLAYLRGWWCASKRSAVESRVVDVSTVWYRFLSGGIVLDRFGI